MGKKRTDNSKLLLLAACLALAGVVLWQQSATQVAPPKPLQLTPAAAPSASLSAPVVAQPATENAAVLPKAKPDSAAPKQPAPRREVRPAAPTAATSRSNAASRSNTAVAPPAAVAPKPAPVAPVAATPAPAATPEEPRRAFMVIHDHSKGNFEKDPKASCVGELILSGTEIKFDGVGAGDSHHFEASWTEVLEAGSNRFFGSGMGGFHVTIKPDGKYQNFNLVPKSKDKAEAKLIVELLKANAKRTDRAK